MPEMGVVSPNYYNFDKLGGLRRDASCLCRQRRDTRRPVRVVLQRVQQVPSWTGVEFLTTSRVRKSGIGPVGMKWMEAVQPGHIAVRRRAGPVYAFVYRVGGQTGLHNILVTHTYDSADRPLSSYGLTNPFYYRACASGAAFFK